MARALTSDEDEKAEDDFPWCTICNEDATLRCLDCENDLYCRRCWAECHGEFELDHRKVAFQPKSGKSMD